MTRPNQREKKPWRPIKTDGQLEAEQVQKFLKGKPRTIICCPLEAIIIIQSHGAFRVYSADEAYGQRLAKWLENNFGKTVGEGEIFLGLVARDLNFGTFLALTVHGHEGLLHYSRYPKTPFTVGDLMVVRVAEVGRMGRIGLEAV
ncbi:MAG: hypothetical protein WC768_00040 [Patescibacteria group bacterium]|jgi:polyribonucleotide nucleotidyltransferase